MKLITDSYKVGQIPQEIISKNVKLQLETKASFKDADKTLKEVIVSRGDIEELIELRSDDSTKAALMDILSQMDALNLSYIHVTKV